MLLVYSLYLIKILTQYPRRGESMRADPKKHKRTPSFTTRRRTQSFRRHTKNLNTMENLPPVEVDGFLDRKQVRSSFLHLFGNISQINKKTEWIIFWDIYPKSTKTKWIQQTTTNPTKQINISSPGASIWRETSHNPFMEELLHSPLWTAHVLL